MGPMNLTCFITRWSKSPMKITPVQKDQGRLCLFWIHNTEAFRQKCIQIIELKHLTETRLMADAWGTRFSTISHYISVYEVLFFQEPSPQLISSASTRVFSHWDDCGQGSKPKCLCTGQWLTTTPTHRITSHFPCFIGKLHIYNRADGLCLYGWPIFQP